MMSPAQRAAWTQLLATVKRLRNIVAEDGTGYVPGGQVDHPYVAHGTFMDDYLRDACDEIALFAEELAEATEVT